MINRYYPFFFCALVCSLFFVACEKDDVITDYHDLSSAKKLYGVSIDDDVNIFLAWNQNDSADGITADYDVVQADLSDGSGTVGVDGGIVRYNMGALGRMQQVGTSATYTAYTNQSSGLSVPSIVFDGMTDSFSVLGITGFNPMVIYGTAPTGKTKITSPPLLGTVNTSGFTVNWSGGGAADTVQIILFQPQGSNDQVFIIHRPDNGSYSFSSGDLAGFQSGPFEMTVTRVNWNLDTLTDGRTFFVGIGSSASKKYEFL